MRLLADVILLTPLFSSIVQCYDATDTDATSVGTHVRDFLEFVGAEKGGTAVVLRVCVALLVAPCVVAVRYGRQLTLRRSSTSSSKRSSASLGTAAKMSSLDSMS